MPIDERHFCLWALDARQKIPGHLSYSGQWQFAPPAGYRQSTERDALGEITAEDQDLADLVGRMVFRLQQHHPRWARALRCFYGLEGRNPRRKKRAREIGMTVREMYDSADLARRWIIYRAEEMPSNSRN